MNLKDRWSVEITETNVAGLEPTGLFRIVARSVLGRVRKKGVPDDLSVLEADISRAVCEKSGVDLSSFPDRYAYYEVKGVDVVTQRIFVQVRLALI